MDVTVLVIRKELLGDNKPETHRKTHTYISFHDSPLSAKRAKFGLFLLHVKRAAKAEYMFAAQSNWSPF